MIDMNILIFEFNATLFVIIAFVNAMLLLAHFGVMHL